MAIADLLTGTDDLEGSQIFLSYTRGNMIPRVCQDMYTEVFICGFGLATQAPDVQACAHVLSIAEWQSFVKYRGRIPKARDKFINSTLQVHCDSHSHFFSFTSSLSQLRPISRLNISSSLPGLFLCPPVVMISTDVGNSTVIIKYLTIYSLLSRESLSSARLGGRGTV
jgi:hypothetical protein